MAPCQVCITIFCRKSWLASRESAMQSGQTRKCHASSGHAGVLLTAMLLTHVTPMQLLFRFLVAFFELCYQHGCQKRCYMSRREAMHRRQDLHQQLNYIVTSQHVFL